MAYNDNLTTYTGADAYLYFKVGATGVEHGGLGIGDFSLTLDRGTVEQELVGRNGNYFTQGAISIEGSLTSVKLDESSAGIFLESVIGDSTGPASIQVSGGVNETNGVIFDFKSCQVTGFDISIGDASTITEGSIDFVVLNPYDLETTKDGTNGTTKLSVAALD